MYSIITSIRSTCSIRDGACGRRRLPLSGWMGALGGGAGGCTVHWLAAAWLAGWLAGGSWTSTSCVRGGAWFVAVVSRGPKTGR